MGKSKLVKDSWLIIPTIILLAYLMIRLVDQSQIIDTFPLDTTNDWSSYMAQAHFLKVCGFHNSCPYWYGGFTSFLAGSPGTSFFIISLDLMIHNLNAAAYAGLIIILLLALIACFKLGQVLKFSKMKSIFLFAAYFGNALAIGNFIRLGRISSLFAFMLGLWVTYIIFKYKDQKINIKFLWVIIPFTLLIITHYQETILVSLIPLCLLLYKKSNLEKNIIFLVFLLAILLSSFWSFPFLADTLFNKDSSLLESSAGSTIQWDKAMIPDVIASSLVGLAFISLFIMRFLTSKNRKDSLKFYLPILTLALLTVSMINTRIPFLNNISLDPITQFILLFTLILLLELKDSFKYLKTVVLIALIIVPLLSITISHIHTPYFTKYTNTEYELLDALDHTIGPFIMLAPNSETSYPKAYYSLATIKYNLTTPSGWYEAIAPKKQLDKLSYLGKAFNSNNCKAFTSTLQELKVNQVIGYADYCEKLKLCGLKIEYARGNACIFNS